MHVPMFDLRVSDLQTKDRLLEALSRVLEHGRLFLGPEVEEFEDRVAKTLGIKYAVGVSSGSSALFLALKAAGIREGDEVITTPLTWIISSNAIRACGAKPVFVDVRDDFNIDPAKIADKVTARTRAILPVHYAGHMCDMEVICDLAERYNLFIVEDAAQAFGASLKYKKAGSYSVAAGISMNPMKAFGGYGEAGAVVTEDEAIFRRLKLLRHAGTTSDPKKIITNDCREVSLNHKMDTINAALLLVALDNLPEKMLVREKIAQSYNEKLPWQIGRQVAASEEIHGRYVYPIRLKQRNELQLFLENNQVETKIMHDPLVCDAPIYKDYIGNVENARKVLKESLVIPSHEKLTSGQVCHIIELIGQFVENHCSN